MLFNFIQGGIIFNSISLGLCEQNNNIKKKENRKLNLS